MIAKLKSVFWSVVFMVAMAGVLCRDTLLGLLGLKKKEAPAAEAVEEVQVEVAAVQEERAAALEEKKDAIEVQAEQRKEADPVAVGNEIVARRRNRAASASKPAAKSAPARSTRKSRKR